MNHRVLLVSSAALLVALAGGGGLLCLRGCSESAGESETPAAEVQAASAAAVAEGRRLMAEAERLRWGKGEALVQRDALYSRAAALFREAADAGDADGLYEFGKCCLRGEGGKKDEPRALQCFQLAVQAGHAAAHCELGDCYVRGTSVERDCKRAVELYNIALAKGEPGALDSLAYSYFYGWGVRPDGARAIEYSLRARELGARSNLEFFWVDREEALERMGGTRAENRAESISDALYARTRLREYLATRLPGEALPESPQKLLERGMELAEQGDGMAALRVADCLANGYELGADGEVRGVDGDRALHYYHMAVLHGEEDALSALHHAHKYCCFIQRDAAQRAVWEGLAASRGDADAAAHLAKGYAGGETVEKSADKAAFWYCQACKAAEKPGVHALALRELLAEGGVSLPMLHFLAGEGNAEVQAYLGRCYEMGQGVAQDMALALLCYHKAAEQEQAEALYRLGLCYAEGRGVSADAHRALLYLERAAKAEAAPVVAEEGERAPKSPGVGATLYLARCYEEGRLVERDPLRALELSLRALRLWESEEAGCMVQGLMNSGLIDTVPEEGHACFAEACVWMSLASSTHEPAWFWRRRAARIGDVESCLLLAESYEKGAEGLPQDAAEAAVYYRMAAEKGSGQGMLRLALCYEEGRGLPQDAEKALSFYRQAAEEGRLAAQLWLARYYLRGEEAQRDAAQGVLWCKKAFYQLDAEAAELLAQCYEKGEGVQQNGALAQEIRQLLAEEED